MPLATQNVSTWLSFETCCLKMFLEFLWIGNCGVAWSGSLSTVVWVVSVHNCRQNSIDACTHIHDMRCIYHHNIKDDKSLCLIGIYCVSRHRHQSSCNADLTQVLPNWTTSFQIKPLFNLHICAVKRDQHYLQFNCGLISTSYYFKRNGFFLK